MLSKEFKIPLHPNFIFYWTQISKQEFSGLLDCLKNSRVDKKIIFPYSSSDQEKFKLGKRALELLGIEHEVTIENVVLSSTKSKALFVNLGIDLELLEKEGFLLKEVFDGEKYHVEKEVFEIINSVS